MCHFPDCISLSFSCLFYNQILQLRDVLHNLKWIQTNSFMTVTSFIVSANSCNKLARYYQIGCKMYLATVWMPFSIRAWDELLSSLSSSVRSTFRFRPRLSRFLFFCFRSSSYSSRFATYRRLLGAFQYSKSVVGMVKIHINHNHNIELCMHTDLYHLWHVCTSNQGWQDLQMEWIPSRLFPTK